MPAFATQDILAAGIAGKRQKETKNIQTAIQSVLCTGSAWRGKVREKKEEGYYQPSSCGRSYRCLSEI